MAITRKQGAGMAVIVVAGAIAATLVLTGGKRVADTADTADNSAESAAPPVDADLLHAAGGQAHRHANASSAAHPDTDGAPRHIRLTPGQQAAAGIVTEPVAARTVRAVSAFSGEVRLHGDRTAHVVPRYAGVIEEVPAELGQRVRRGEVLAVLTSTELAAQRSALLVARKRRELARSTHDREQRLWTDGISAEQDHLQAKNALQEADIAVQDAQQQLAAVGADTGGGRLNRYALRAPFDATIVEKHITRGEAVKADASIFTLADLSTVWVTFAVPPQQLPAVQIGGAVEVRSTAFAASAAGTVSYLGAVLGEQTRSATARVTLPNRDGAWRPGLYVTVTVAAPAPAAASANSTAVLAVGAEAVQTVDGQPTVFVADAAGFVARPVQVGRADGLVVEIVAGLRAGERVAVANSFVLKAELGKSGAGGHAH